MAESPIAGQYEEAVDRESAYELLEAREARAAKEEAELAEREAKEKAKKAPSRRRSSSRQSIGEAAIKSGVRVLSREVVRYLLRGVLGGRRR